jgi:hypothetical protein
MAGKRCGWCRKRIWFWQFEAGFLSSAVRTGKPFHLDCQAEREKHPAISDRQVERVEGWQANADDVEPCDHCDCRTDHGDTCCDCGDEK